MGGCGGWRVEGGVVVRGDGGGLGMVGWECG